MPIQQGADPAPAFRVRWEHAAGVTEWRDALVPPQVQEGCLVLRITPRRLLWVPLHTITGPIEVEGM
ncbi:hypothetical protein ABZ135_18425 [Streptomyces sp. NPDC006339]|uniref:hypothetical protein n=1 Tax=Streptomyces sp. NPDC006339 TaxID=3156755 RepID=UPI0033B259D2